MKEKKLSVVLYAVVSCALLAAMVLAFISLLQMVDSDCLTCNFRNGIIHNY